MVSILMWVLSGVLTAVFLMAGTFKAFKIDDAAAKMTWVDKFGRDKARMIGFAEILGAFGLTLPLIVNIAGNLAAVAAICLAVLMFGAVVMHFKWGEQKTAPMPAVLGIASAVVAYLHFA